MRFVALGEPSRHLPSTLLGRSTWNLRTRNRTFKERVVCGDREYMVVLNALVTAITFTLVLYAGRLTIELEAAEEG